MPRENPTPAVTRVRSAQRLLATLLRESTPVEMQLLGRTLLRAALVGIAAGLLGSGFLWALGLVEHLLLVEVAGYVPLLAGGESAGAIAGTPFRPWILALLPALGALVAGWITRWAPEARGGGADQAIDAFHRLRGIVRRRVLLIKPLASIATLGSGGSGGREGPTMLIGAAIGSTLSDFLRVGARERRLLLVAGIAAGISAVFKTPLGAALLAIEVLYRDDFESQALVPALLASVMAYAVAVSLQGTAPLFAHAEAYAFAPTQLPLYVLMAVLLALMAYAFLAVLRAVRSATARLRLPEWVRPAAGALLLGLLAAPLVEVVGRVVGAPGQGLGILGSGYGAAQIAITGSSLLPPGWEAVQLMLMLALAKLVATALTVGSGGSAGDFAPSLVLGALFGGAFGRAAQILLNDPSIDPGAFALVGMGAFYGAIAHVPIAALILVSELAGTYELLVPSMLAGGVALVLVRQNTLYPAQPRTQRDSPVHRAASAMDVLQEQRARDLMRPVAALVTFGRAQSLSDVLHASTEAIDQALFPVVDERGRLVGVITDEGLRFAGRERTLGAWAIAEDAMQPAAAVVAPDQDLRRALLQLLEGGLRALPVVDSDGLLLGILDESDLQRVWLESSRSDSAGDR